MDKTRQITYTAKAGAILTALFMFWVVGCIIGLLIGCMYVADHTQILDFKPTALHVVTIPVGQLTVQPLNTNDQAVTFGQLQPTLSNDRLQ